MLEETPESSIASLLQQIESKKNEIGNILRTINKKTHRAALLSGIEDGGVRKSGRTRPGNHPPSPNPSSTAGPSTLPPRQQKQAEIYAQDLPLQNAKKIALEVELHELERKLREITGRAEEDGSATMILGSKKEYTGFMMPPLSDEEIRAAMIYGPSNGSISRLVRIPGTTTEIPSVGTILTLEPYQSLDMEPEPCCFRVENSNIGSGTSSVVIMVKEMEMEDREIGVYDEMDGETGEVYREKEGAGMMAMKVMDLDTANKQIHSYRRIESRLGCSAGSFIKYKNGDCFEVSWKGMSKMDGQSVDDGMAGVGNEGKIGCVVMPLGRGLDDVLSGGSGFLYGDEGSNEAFASSLLQFVIPLSPIIRGVGQLQRLKMVHQDLKLENFLLLGCDYGTSSSSTPSSCSKVSTSSSLDPSIRHPCLRKGVLIDLESISNTNQQTLLVGAGTEPFMGNTMFHRREMDMLKMEWMRSETMKERFGFRGWEEFKKLRLSLPDTAAPAAQDDLFSIGMVILRTIHQYGPPQAVISRSATDRVLHHPATLAEIEETLYKGQWGVFRELVRKNEAWYKEFYQPDTRIEKECSRFDVEIKYFWEQELYHLDHRFSVFFPLLRACFVGPFEEVVNVGGKLPAEIGLDLVLACQELVDKLQEMMGSDEGG